MAETRPELLNNVYREISEKLGMDTAMEIYRMFKRSNSYARRRWEKYQETGDTTTETENALRTSASVEEYLNKKVYYPKGHDLVKEESEELLRNMLDYPNNYVGMSMSLRGFPIGSITKQVTLEAVVGECGGGRERGGYGVHLRYSSMSLSIALGAADSGMRTVTA